MGYGRDMGGIDGKEEMGQVGKEDCENSKKTLDMKNPKKTFIDSYQNLALST